MIKIIDRSGIFCTCGEKGHNDKSLQCSDSDMITDGLIDARQAMNYSNWHCDKFDRAIEIVKAFSDLNCLPRRFI